MKLAKIFLVIGLFFSISVSAFAAEENDIYSIRRNESPKGDTEIAFDVLEANRARDRAEIEKMGEIELVDLAQNNRATSWIMEGSDLYVLYSQEANNECGIASIKMLIHNIKGVSPTRAEIKDGVRFTDSTDISRIPSYLNSQLNSYGYSYATRWSTNATLLRNEIYNTISSGSSVMANVRFYTTGGWPYNTEGHYFNLRGISSDYNHVRIVDPWGGYAHMSSWSYYERTTDDLMSVLKYGYIHT